jgi:site-specific DNA-methyltransferase (adenine-specific)
MDRCKLDLRNCDCIDLMREYPDKYFEWGCIDPPYGLGNRLSDGGGKLKNTPMSVLYKNKDWDALPTKIFWDEFFRTTKNQIIFGANYFLEYLPNTRGFVCWDKLQEMPTLSACELIWTSLDKPAKIIKCSSMDLNRFHPTQKPIKVYKKIFEYCKIKEGDKILDSHLGSMSSAIACWDMRFDLTGSELDKDYFDAGIKRVEQHKKQLQLF